MVRRTQRNVAREETIPLCPGCRILLYFLLVIYHPRGITDDDY